MGAFEETKCRRSIVSDTFQCLTDQAKRLREKIDLLEAGQRLDRDEAIADLGRLFDACQNLRDAILSEDSGATWKNTTELHSLVDRLDEVAAKRKRYLDLAQFLVAGTVSHRRERTKQERLRQRDAAVAELMEVSAQPTLAELPGPAVGEWLNWACSLDDSTDDPDLAKLKSTLPRVDDFVRQLEIEMWQDGRVSISEQMVDAVPAMENEPHGTADGTVQGIGGTPVAGAPANDGGAKAEAASSSGNSVLIQDAPDAAATSTTETATAEADVAEPKASDAPEKAPKPARKIVTDGKRTLFFDPEEIQGFKRYIDEARTESKSLRSVRSLLGVSQWLLPSDQNPILHPAFGIRAQVGYAGSSDLLAVAPEEAARAIDAESDLLLFTGGADLLRWSIAQRAEGHEDGIAAIRRLTIEQIRAWFGEVYKIELAEPQVLDMFRLTTGIPLLVGELHRLVLPNPKTPPTWLGYAIWTNVKTAFERRLPVLARELRNGSPAVRLTEQEIRVLKMVVIASDDSTPDTILTNLRDNWDKYHRPEIQALSTKDEPRVKLLQTLGLLPIKTGSGGGPLKALLPVQPDDALRQIVSYL
ncbi:MAG: hypothetical protein WB679_03635 [Terracidiphilus sp.]